MIDPIRLIVSASNAARLSQIEWGAINCFLFSVKPQNIQLLTNATSNQACLGSYLNFTCSVGSANPPVTSYELFKNDVVVDTSSSGMWIRMLPNSGVFTYKCLANNTQGTANSTSVIITFGGKYDKLSRKKNSEKSLTQPFDVVMTSLSSDKIIILKFYFNL